jgi:hypothetical protein
MNTFKGTVGLVDDALENKDRIPPLRSTTILSEDARQHRLPLLSAPPKLIPASQIASSRVSFKTSFKKPVQNANAPVKMSLKDLKALEMAVTPQKPKHNVFHASFTQCALPSPKRNQEKIKELLESIPDTVDCVVAPLQDIPSLIISLLPHQAEGNP